MIILLDSTTLIDALRKEPSTVAELSKLFRDGHRAVTSVVNVGEVYAGARPHELLDIEELLSGVDAYPVTFAIAKHAGELRNAAARKGRTLELDDMLVAATALALKCPVITDNLKDFKGTGVTFYGAGEN